MVDIIPLRGLFYNEKKAGNISSVISPPYDVISSSLKKELHNYSPFNIVNLLIPGGKSDEKYTIAGELFSSWMEKGIFKLDSKRCFYVFQESFVHCGKGRKISGFIGLTRLEPYSNLQIMPHEKTLSSVKKDRLKLLSKCRTNFGLVFTLYKDRQKKIKSILDNNTNKTPVINTHASYDLDLKCKLWKISDDKDINKIIDLMKTKKLIIADGHHRYETSLKYRNDYVKKFKPEDLNNNLIPEDFILTLYIDSSQTDFLILPYYRLIKFKKYPGLKDLIKIISQNFEAEIYPPDSTDFIKEKLLSSKLKGSKSFFLYGGERNLYFITLKNVDLEKNNHKNIQDRDYSSLDINILHKLIMQKIVGRHEIKKISFSHSISKVIKSIDSREFDIGIFLNPPTVEELERTCSTGYLMPEKTTYFCPKPCSGLVMYTFDSYY
jgi:uncharacterized protein (DUF1015 family)